MIDLPAPQLSEAMISHMAVKACVIIDAIAIDLIVAVLVETKTTCFPKPV
jgi:hypothetical protein